MKGKCLFVVLILIFALSVTAAPVFGTDLKKFKGQKIVVTCWSGPYVENFKNAVVNPFMKESGAIVVVSPGWSEFISKIKASPEDKPPYDVFIADGWNYIAAMNINRLHPIRKENIPNAKDIFPALLQRDAWVKGYGVPFDGGLYLPVYAPKATGFRISSWKDMMKPELHGKLTLDQAFYYGLYAAAYISDMEPGAKELYSKEGLDECFKLSAQLAKSVKKFYKGGAEFFNLLQTGEVAMGAYYSGGTYAQKNKGVDVDMVLADEGVIAWIGYMTVMKGTKNRDLAEAFINYSLDPKRQSAFAKGSGNWVSGSKAEVPAALKGINPSSDKDFQKITFFDWDLLNNKWTELEERWKKEVLVQPQ